MNLHTRKGTQDGPAGPLELAFDDPAAEGAAAVGVAVLCHPHPVHGGTMDNKVVQTLARAFLLAGWRTVRFNFRGVGASSGTWDHGRGEIDDAMAVIEAQREAGQPLAIAGFSFGAYVASQAAARLREDPLLQRLVLIAPAAVNFDVASVPPHTLVVHGESDDVVPLQATLDWARPQALPVVVVPGVGHFFHGQLTLLRHVVARHLAAPVA